MKEYLQIRKERFNSAKSAQVGCLVLLIIFFVLVSIGFFTVDQIDGVSNFAIVFIIVFLFIVFILIIKCSLMSFSCYFILLNQNLIFCSLILAYL